MKVTNIINGVEQVLEGLSVRDGKVRVEINKNQLDIHITFEYNQLLGTITIKYVDQDGNEIAEPTILRDLPLGTYEVTAKEIEGYELKVDDEVIEGIGSNTEITEGTESNTETVEDVEVIEP